MRQSSILLLGFKLAGQTGQPMFGFFSHCLGFSHGLSFEVARLIGKLEPSVSLVLCWQQENERLLLCDATISEMKLSLRKWLRVSL